MGGCTIVEEKQEPLEALCRKYNVQQLSLFGSATRDDFDDARSDLDFVVTFGPPPSEMRLAAQYFDFADELEALFGRRVDLLERSAIKNTYIKKAVESAVALYAA